MVNVSRNLVVTPSEFSTIIPDLIPRRVTYEEFNSKILALQAFANGQILTGHVKHQLLVSLDYNRKDFLGYAG